MMVHCVTVLHRRMDVLQNKQVIYQDIRRSDIIPQLFPAMMCIWGEQFKTTGLVGLPSQRTSGQAATDWSVDADSLLLRTSDPDRA